MLGLGDTTFLDPARTCDSADATAGDTCVTTSVSGGHVSPSSQTYDQHTLDAGERKRRILGGAGMCIGPVLILGACWFTVRGVRSGQRLRARLVLTAHQAYGGGTETIEFRGWTHCTRCANGTAFRTSGRQPSTLPPVQRQRPREASATRGHRARPRGREGREHTEVPGREVPGKGGGPAGDLLLSVRISGPGPTADATTRSRTATPPARQRPCASPPKPKESGGPRGRQPGQATSRRADTRSVGICADGIRITVDQESVTVEEERRSPTGRASWFTTHELRWPDISCWCSTATDTIRSSPCTPSRRTAPVPDTDGNTWPTRVRLRSRTGKRWQSGSSDTATDELASIPPHVRVRAACATPDPWTAAGAEGPK